jgi:hypothetical protein
MTTWGVSYQIENYLKTMVPMSMVFTMGDDGHFWALYMDEAGNYHWSRDEAALFWTEQSYHYEPMIISMTGEFVPIAPQAAYTDHDLSMAWELAQQRGGFMVNPMEKDCPVKVNWDEWVLYASKDERRNVKFKLVGMG